MAISTYKTFLMHKASTKWEKLIDIKDYPDLGGSPEMLETTTLTQKMRTYIPGIQSLEALTFKTNYDKTEFEKLKALEGQDKEYAVWFGGTESGGTVTPDGNQGKYKFKGQLSVFINGADVNAVVDMTITIAPSTPIEPDTSA